MEITPSIKKALLVSEETHRALKIYAAESGRKISETVETFIRDGIEKERLKKAE
jgi:hypothetical protein